MILFWAVPALRAGRYASGLAVARLRLRRIFGLRPHPSASLLLAPKGRGAPSRTMVRQCASERDSSGTTCRACAARDGADSPTHAEGVGLAQIFG
jgi:hypothetical protein